MATKRKAALETSVAGEKRAREDETVVERVRCGLEFL